MSGSRTRSRQDEEDVDDDVNATAIIYPTVLAALVTALTGSIISAVSNATTS